MPMQSWGVPTNVEPAPEPGERALPPVHWPRPGAPALALVGLWLAGVLLAVLAPAFIVPPAQDSAAGGDVLMALGCTLLGAAVMALAGYLLYRRHPDQPVAWTFGVVPAVTLTVGGLIMAATKYFAAG